MSLRGLFKRAGNKIEGEARIEAEKQENELITCKQCRNTIRKDNFDQNIGVCPKCGYHHKISARERLSFLCDGESFEEMNSALRAKDYLNFPEYKIKLEEAHDKSGENESVITGTGKIFGIKCCLFVMEPRFMMGSMGAVTGEKITRLFEFATSKSLPVVGFTVSGGARMQEGMFSLMQMAKVSAGVKRHSDAGNLYIAVLTDPTTGGVTASFAMLGDIIIGEPGALIGFAGPRVIEQTIKQRLPEDFQTAEYVLKCGFLDCIAPRQTHRVLLKRLLLLHGYKEEK